MLVIDCVGTTVFLTFILSNVPVVHLNKQNERKNMLQRCNINVMLCTFGVLKSYMCKIIVMEPKYKINISTSNV